MLRRQLKAAVVLLAAFLLSHPVAGQTTATIDINTAVTTPIHPGFSGISDDLLSAVEYWDYRFNTLAAEAGFGWVRFPGGNTSDAYSWQTGQEVAAWVDQFAGSVAGLSQAAVRVAGKGGARPIDAANRARFFGASLIVCANGFTDTPQSIGALAAYVKANQIPVAAWELSNEAYLFPNLFATATAYLDQMKPYRDAIKAVDPNAIVAVFVRDPENANPQNAWDMAIAAYPNKYWDAISFHHYPPQSLGSFAQWMADETAVLVNRTNVLLTGPFASIGPPGVKFLNTEFDPSIANDPKSGAASITKGTLWGGIYAAEYTMRMSTVPSLLYVGPSAIWNNAGVEATTDHTIDVEDAAKQGQTINTLSLDFGFYVAAQANGMAVLNSVINHAVAVNQTTVTGGGTVPATGIPGGVPALYAMSYSNSVGGLSVVITNKSATEQGVMIRVNGQVSHGPFPVQFVSGTDPSLANTASNPKAVSVQTASFQSSIVVPPYSVLRVDLMTPPVATFFNAASIQTGPASPAELVTFAGPPSSPGLEPTSVTITDSTGSMSTARVSGSSGASFVMPARIALGPARVEVMHAGATVLTGVLTVTGVAPGIYSANQNGAGVALATAAVGTTGAPLPVYTCQGGIGLSCLSTPIPLSTASGTVNVVLSGTGIRGASSVEAYVAGHRVPVLGFGAQDPDQSLDHVTISLPTGTGLEGLGESSLYIVADGKTSNMTTLYIH